MLQKPKFSVIIVNYNGGDYLSGAVASLAAQTCTDFDIFVIDNGSTDHSTDAVFGLCGTDKDQHGDQCALSLPSSMQLDKFISLQLELANKNLGFATGNNRAARQASGEWLVLLNPDAVAAPHWLENIADAIQRHPGTHMFASTQIDMHNPDTLDGVGDAYFGFGIPWRGGFGRPISELPDEGTCFSPCGAGAVYKRETFLSHDGFDERFFCFCEDVDIGYRMRLAGEQCIFLPDAVIHHAGGGITGRASDFSLYHGSRNRMWTYLKNTPLRLLIVTFPVHVALILAILYRNRKTTQFRSSLRGLRDAIKGAGPILKSRWAQKKHRKASLSQIASAMCWNLATLRQRKSHVRRLPSKSE